MSAKHFVVITETEDWIMCRGVYKSHLEAYGKALLVVNEYMKDTHDERDKISISALQPLETDSGFAIRGKYNTKTKISAYVLFDDDIDDGKGQETE